MANTSSRFKPHGPFHSALHQRVKQHFATTGTVSNDARGIRLKTFVIAAWFLGSYTTLLFGPPVWLAALCSVSLGLAMAGIGFNIQHDGNHGSYSTHRWLNGLMSFGLDVLGGSSYVWHWKHNVFHHSNPNIGGRDADIDVQPFCRLAPCQTRYAAHRYQHIYIWFLYSLLAVKWHFVDDFRDVIRGKIGDQTFPRPRGWQMVGLIGGKLLFVSWALVIPMLLHPVASVLACYAIASVTVSLTLAITFQLAHVTEGASFPQLSACGRCESEWAVHQAESSLNFATGNKLLTWYIGGLNFQIEHHLFPRVSHLHLQEISKIVQATCKEFGVSYRVEPTIRGAIASHTRWVKQLGQQPMVETMAEPTVSSAQL